MKKNYFKLIFLILSEVFLLNNFCSAQNISGIINTYTSVNAISGTTISVSSAAGYTAGGKVLIIQMKGASIDQSNSSTYGDILSYNNCGNYEYANVVSVNGNNIIIQSPLCRQYSIPDLVQLITVPQYTNPVVTSTLLCQDWNGTTGGVLVFEASGTVLLNADIDVSGNGFRGGSVCLAGFGCNNTNYFLPLGQGGQKGEGIADYVTSQQGGRGKLSNGGGGGNPGNCGGGGGGNYGSGGNGGFEYSGCGGTGIQGIAGANLNYSGGKVFMGAGGGGGFSDNSQAVTPGTDGGGIVIITANAIDGNNFFIRSDAPDQTLIANDESAGGGGAGGTVFLSVNNFLSVVNVSASGGDGGNTYNNIFTFDCHGPGGGGGGGLLWLSNAALPANVIFNGAPGQPGLVQNPSSSCYNTTFGATAGLPGNYLLNLPSIDTIIPVALGNDTAVCVAQAFTLDAGTNYASYLWSDGSVQQTISVAQTGTYSVTVTNAAGCVDVDTLTVSLLPPIIFSLGNDTSVCAGSPVNMDAGAGFASYNWHNGTVTQTYISNDSGAFSVTVTDSLGCSGSDTMNISYTNPSPPVFANDTSICFLDTVVFDAGPGATYLWNNGSTTQTINAWWPGIYSVTVTDAGGCSTQAAGSLAAFISPIVTVMHDTFMCPGTPTYLQANQSFSSYFWSDSSGLSIDLISMPGTYSVTVTNSFGCTGEEVFTVEEKCPVEVFFPNAFTPNTDGNNDFFSGIGVNVSSFRLRIYNRWGQVVFESESLNDKWDGTLDDIPCGMGVYVFVASYSGMSGDEKISGVKKGNVILLR